MSLLLDLIVIAVFAISLIAGIYKGFIRSVMGIGVLIATVILSSSLAAPFGRYLDDNFVHSAVSSEVERAIDGLTDDVDGINLEKLFEEKPKVFTDILERFDMNFDNLKNYFETDLEGSNEAKEALAEYIAVPVSVTLSKAIAFAVLFIGFLILLTLAMKLLNLLFRLPILNGTNKLLGAIFGGVRGFIFVWGISVALCYLMPHLAVMYEETVPSTVIENTYLVKLLGNLDVMQLL